MAGITDLLESYRGFFEKGTNHGSLWLGNLLNPLPKFLDNFNVVSTDYEKYAILY